MSQHGIANEKVIEEEAMEMWSIYNRLEYGSAKPLLI